MSGDLLRTALFPETEYTFHLKGLTKLAIVEPLYHFVTPDLILTISPTFTFLFVELEVEVVSLNDQVAYRVDNVPPCIATLRFDTLAILMSSLPILLFLLIL